MIWMSGRNCTVSSTVTSTRTSSASSLKGHMATQKQGDITRNLQSLCFAICAHYELHTESLTDRCVFNTEPPSLNACSSGSLVADAFNALSRPTG